MTLRFIFSIIFILYSFLWCSAQKIKVQKEQVFVDDKEALTIRMLEHDKLKTWLVLTPTGDTTTTFVENRIELVLLPHELFKRKYNYYEVQFNETDKIGYMDSYSIGGVRSIAEMFRECFVDGKYQVGCASSFLEKNCNWSVSKISDIKGANKLRDSLLNNNEYLKYSATLPKRNASIKFEILPDSSIMVFDVKIGRVHQLLKGTVSTTYRVLNEKNKPLATINYESGRKRVFIRTLTDDAGKEYFIEHEFRQSDIYDAIGYLVDYGYL